MQYPFSSKLVVKIVIVLAVLQQLRETQLCCAVICCIIVLSVGVSLSGCFDLDHQWDFLMFATVQRASDIVSW